MQTSYFANYRNFPKDAKLVSIANYAPPGFKGKVMKTLAPPLTLLNKYKLKKVSEAEFTSEYIAHLEAALVNFSKEEIVRDLGNSILLCYEAQGDFCHRHLLTKWLGVGSVELKT